MNILIAEDHPTTQTMLSHWVETWGYTPIQANNGQEAWAFLQSRTQPCLAILDWMMPAPSGKELCQQIKQETEKPFVYTLILTSKSKQEDVVAGLNAGADDYLIKPIEPEELRSRLLAGQRIIGYQEKLAERNAQLQALLTAMPDAVLLKDAEGHWLEANHYALRLFGLEDSTYRGKSDTSLTEYPGASREALLSLNKSDQRAWQQDGIHREEVVLTHAQDNEQLWYELVRTPLFYGDGRRKGLVMLGHEITARKVLEEQLRDAAYYDALTNLYNRRYFHEHLRKMMNFAKRSDLPLSLCLCDIDNFKHINDEYGRDIGDKVLMKFSQFIREQLRQADLAGRFGGDEFCIAFPGTHAEQGVICLERIRQQFTAETFHSHSVPEFKASASFGIVEWNNTHMDERLFIHAADQALYRAKTQGRDKIEIYQAA